MSGGEAAEKFFGSGAGGGTELVERAGFDLGGDLGDFLHVGRFAAFAAIRNGSEERRIRFEHETVERGGREGVADILAVFEGENSGEADQGVQVENAAHGGGVICKTVKNAAQASAERFKLSERIFEAIALVDDDVEAQFGSHFQMLLKEVGLLLFVDGIVLGA